MFISISLLPAGLRFASLRLSRRFECSGQPGGDVRRAAPLLQSQAARPRPLPSVSQRQPQRRRRAGDSRGRVRRAAPPPQGPALRGEERGRPDGRRGVRHPGQPADRRPAATTRRVRFPTRAGRQRGERRAVHLRRATAGRTERRRSLRRNNDRMILVRKYSNQKIFHKGPKTLCFGDSNSGFFSFII